MNWTATLLSPRILPDGSVNFRFCLEASFTDMIGIAASVCREAKH